LSLAALANGHLLHLTAVYQPAAPGIVVSLIAATRQRIWTYPAQLDLVPSLAAASSAALVAGLLFVDSTNGGDATSAGHWVWIHHGAGGETLPAERGPGVAARTLKWTAGTWVLIGGLMGVLLCPSRLLDGRVLWGHAALLAFQLATTTLSGVVSTHQALRISFRAMAAIIAMLALFVVNADLDLTLSHRIEIVTLAAGVFLLGFGHDALLVEGATRDDTASIATVTPLMIGVFAHRWLFLTLARFGNFFTRGRH
jgi:hypothetical protein